MTPDMPDMPDMPDTHDSHDSHQAHEAPAQPAGSTREARLRARLEARFAPLELVIEDESRYHAGHAGAAGGHGHYRVRIVAEAFRGVSPVARHRLVYEAVGDLLQTDIHALAIEASPPA